MPVDPRTPVLIGHGQVNHRDEIDPDKRSVEPLDLMVAAARKAADAADPKVLEAVDSVRVVNILSAQYRDPGLLVGQRIGATKFSTLYSPVGGNVPQSLVNQACLDIQQGRAGLVLLTGAETWRTRRGLRAKGGRLEWTMQDDSVPMAEVAGDDVPMAGDAEIRIGLDRPAYVYPLFEQALRIANDEPVAGARQAHRRALGALQRRRGRQSARVDPRTGDRRGDHPARPTQPDDQRALHQVDELQQHGGPGRGLAPNLG